MNVYIHSPGVELTQALSAQIQRKLTFALSRMEPLINAISITLTDVSGPMGDVGISCRIQLAVMDWEDIVITDTQADIDCAVDRALQRASRTMARRIARQEKKHRHLITAGPNENYVQGPAKPQSGIDTTKGIDNPDD